MQKMKYEVPDMEIIEFESEDIITASGMNDLGASLEMREIGATFSNI